jgi:protein associated with RNAse G/E
MKEGDSSKITVRVLKHDGTEYRRWQAQLRTNEAGLIVLDAEFETDVSHELLGEIRRGTRTVEYYWLDRSYNVFRFLNEDGSTRLWYCNINTPPEFDGSTLTYIDLDIDILVQPDSSFQVLDTEEFEMNCRKYGYSQAEKDEAEKAVNELARMVKARQFPFVLESSSVSSVVK